MPLPEWTFAKIHTDNGSIVNGNYEAVDLESGSFSIHPEGMTPAQTRVLVLGALGLSLDETGETLYYVYSTVTGHRTNILRKLGARNMAHAVTRCFEQGILQVDRTTPLPKPDAEFDLKYINAMAQGATTKQYAAAHSRDVLDVNALGIMTGRNFHQPNMAGVVTLCHLAEILPVDPALNTSITENGSFSD
jgi:DNA-binding CsgD family transcriptional regulator